MKHFYLKAGKAVILFLAVLVSTSARSQFTTAGDIAFTGYTSAAANESFSFVLLKNIPAGSVLNFTDNGWTGSALTNTEQVITWTTGSALVAGREVTISAPPLGTTISVIISGSNINAGTATGTMPSLPTSGDQILAYIGTLAAPTFIAGIHMNQYSLDLAECGNTTVAGWDPVPACTINGNASTMPTGLTGGTTAVWIGQAGVGNTDFDNAKFNCTGAMATAAQVRASVNNYTAGSNWITQNGAPTFTLPSGCAFLASIFALDLVSFSGNSQAGSIALNWKTANEPNDNGYFELEKSADGMNFSRLGRVNAQGFSYIYNNYTYTDNAPLSGANFYRLKIVSENGRVQYSYVLKVLYGKLGRGMVVSPNPAVSEVTITTAGDYTQAVISDRNGRTVLQQRLSGNNNRIDVSRLPAGQYSITVLGASEKTTEKLLIVH